MAQKRGGGIIKKKKRKEGGGTKMNRHRNGGLCISFSQIEHTGEHFQTVHLHGSTNPKKKKKLTTVRERPYNNVPRSRLARDLCYNRYSVAVGFLLNHSRFPMNQSYKDAK